MSSSRFFLSSGRQFAAHPTRSYNGGEPGIRYDRVEYENTNRNWTATGRRKPDANEIEAERARRCGVHPAGSLEAELSAIGKSAPAGEWAKVPADYFAKIDTYLHARTKKK